MDYTRRQVIDYVRSIRSDNTTAELALYAYRDMQTCDWTAFVAAALQRNPVSIEMTSEMSIDQVYTWLGEMGETSIYEGARLAQPDEVANYKTADGLEKAFFLANVIRQRRPDRDIEIIAEKTSVTLTSPDQYSFESDKALKKKVLISGGKTTPILS
ncbi:MAG: hypothetical protein H8E73_07305 [Planctomycetes bacterium]|nr:hypothetical protein [Planctomycetota bacterium]